MYSMVPRTSSHKISFEAELQVKGQMQLVLLNATKKKAEACDEDGSGSMTYDEMLGVFRKFGTSATLSLSSLAAV